MSIHFEECGMRVLCGAVHSICMREHPDGARIECYFFSMAGNVKSICGCKKFCFLHVLYVDGIRGRHGSGAFLPEGRDCCMLASYAGICSGDVALGRCIIADKNRKKTFILFHL